MVLGWSDYRWAHEPCFYAARQGVRPAFYGDGTDTTVWRAQAIAGGQAATSIGTGVALVAKNGQEIYITAAPPKGKKVRHVHLEQGQDILISSGSDQDNLWEVGRDNGHGKNSSLHANQKPVELARRGIRNSSTEGQIVLDMFAGSGSTLMGAEQTNRCACVIGLDPQHVDTIIRRWQDSTGKEAIHGADQASYTDIAKSRKRRKS